MFLASRSKLFRGDSGEVFKRSRVEPTQRSGFHQKFDGGLGHSHGPEPSRGTIIVNCACCLLAEWNNLFSYTLAVPTGTVSSRYSGNYGRGRGGGTHEEDVHPNYRTRPSYRAMIQGEKVGDEAYGRPRKDPFSADPIPI